MQRGHGLGGSTYVSFAVEVYDETLGISYDEGCEFFDISFTGWYSYTPATYMDPPESDGAVELEHTEEELLGWAQEHMDDFDGTLTVTEDAIVDIITEVVTERVMEDPDSYDSTPDPYDEWRDRQLTG